ALSRLRPSWAPGIKDGLLVLVVQEIVLSTYLFHALHLVMHLAVFALFLPRPLFGVMVSVGEKEKRAMHMTSVRAGQIRRVHKIQGNGVEIRRNPRFHSGLVSGGAE